MATQKFEKNLTKMLKLFSEQKELIDFLIQKKAFNDDFINMILNSDYLNNNDNIEDHNLSLDHIKSKIQYKVNYNKSKKKMNVDITPNDIFSYYDTEEELKSKMKNFLNNEEYEKAEILNGYLKTIELDFDID